MLAGPARRHAVDHAPGVAAAKLAGGRQTLSVPDLLALQRTAGNEAVSGLLQLQRAALPAEMTTPYHPGEMSRRYWNLPPGERSGINAKVDATFAQRSGISRRLNRKDPKDRPAVRMWLRIRDQEMASHAVVAPPVPAQPKLNDADEEERINLFNVIGSALSPAILLLNLLHLPVTGVALGIRVGGSIGVVGVVGGGSDFLVFLDVATLKVTPDAIPYAELGIGQGLGGGGALIVAFRVTPIGAKHVAASTSYEAGTANASLKALISFGFGANTSLMHGEEGWLIGTFGAGGEEKGAVTYSYGVSTQNVLEQAGKYQEAGEPHFFRKALVERFKAIPTDVLKDLRLAVSLYETISELFSSGTTPTPSTTPVGPSTARPPTP